MAGLAQRVAGYVRTAYADMETLPQVAITASVLVMGALAALAKAREIRREGEGVNVYRRRERR